MNIVTYATPFFLLAVMLELAWGWFRNNNTYRLNDSVNSLSLGMLSTLSKLMFLNVGAVVFASVENEWALLTLDNNSVLHWIAAIVMFDFCYYWFHRISHERQFFWGSHVVHHQSEDYNLSTALRQTSTGFLATWVFFVPCFLLGMPLYMYVTISTGHLVYQFWIHTRHIPKLGFLEWFLATPSNHRVHHAQNPRYIDKNYGGLLIVWDRLFGTFAEEDDKDEIIYGLRTALNSWNPLWANGQVFIAMFRDAYRAENIRDKIAALTARTGWRPADVALKYPIVKTNLEDYHKYNPALSFKMKIVVMGLYLMMLTYFMWFTIYANQMSYLSQCCNIIALTVSTLIIGAINDGRFNSSLVQQADTN